VSAPSGTSCILDKYIITLQNPLADIEPSGTQAVNAITSGTAYAQVVNPKTKLPKPGVQVRFSVDVVANTGGHDARHSAMRPKGKLLDCRDNTTEVETTICITQLDGRATVTFKAPIVSGTHTIIATCVSPACTSQASGHINVKVGGLKTIPTSPFYRQIGQTDFHLENNYLIPDAATILWRMAAAYHFEAQFKRNGASPPLLPLNDASLTWGGKFDIHGQWTTQGGHSEHRRGTVIDIRANSAAGAISTQNFKKFISLAKFFGARAAVHLSGKATQHFHVRLLGRGE